MANVTVNAIGDACPIPVVKANKALQEMQEPGILEVHVDNEIAVQNVQRMAAGKQLEAKSAKLDDHHFVVTVTVGSAPAADDTPVLCKPDLRGDTVVVVSSDTMGSGSEELGKVLMKGFLYAVSQLETLPKTILFYNGGAKITAGESPSLDDLRSMEAQGVEILTCGTCLDYYGLKDKLAVGGVTNMYNIVDTMNRAARIIRP